MFCNHCGAPLQPGLAACPRCGKPAVVPAGPAAGYVPVAPVRVIPSSLSVMLTNEVLKLPYAQQAIFLDEYSRRSKELAIGYLFQIFLFAHYGYLNKWLLQIIFWLTAGGAGFWWLIDLFRLPNLVHNYNERIAVDLLQQMHAGVRPFS